MKNVKQFPGSIKETVGGSDILGYWRVFDEVEPDFA